VLFGTALIVTNVLTVVVVTVVTVGMDQASHVSCKVLDFFPLKNSTTWKILEDYFGPGKSWKLKLKVLESPGKISLKVMHFSGGSNGKQHPVCVDCCLLKYAVECW